MTICRRCCWHDQATVRPAREFRNCTFDCGAYFVALALSQQGAWVDRAELHSSFRSCDSPAAPDAADPEVGRPSMGLSGEHVAALLLQHADGAAGATSASGPGVGPRRCTLGASPVSMHDRWLLHMEL